MFVPIALTTPVPVALDVQAPAPLSERICPEVPDGTHPDPPPPPDPSEDALSVVTTFTRADPEVYADMRTRNTAPGVTPVQLPAAVAVDTNDVLPTAVKYAALKAPPLLQLVRHSSKLSVPTKVPEMLTPIVANPFCVSTTQLAAVVQAPVSVADKVATAVLALTPLIFWARDPPSAGARGP